MVIRVLTLDLSSSRIQMAALGHTSSPFYFVIRQLLGCFPGQVHLSDVPFDDIYPVLPQSSWLCLVTSQFPVCCLTSCNNGGSRKILNHFVWLADPQNPQQCENSGTYLKCELSYCDFCVEISKCSLPWQQGLVSYTSWVIADFLTKFTNFCYHGNMGGSSENLNDSIWSANPQTPSLVQYSGTYLKCELGDRYFVWKFPNFRFHGNRG